MSDTFQKGSGGPFVSASSWVYASPAQATTVWKDAVANGLLKCFVASVKAGSSGGVKLTVRSSGPATIPQLAEHAAAYSVVATAEAGGRSIPAYYVLVLLGNGPRIAELEPGPVLGAGFRSSSSCRSSGRSRIGFFGPGRDEAPGAARAEWGGVSTETPAAPERHDFIRDIVAADLREGRVTEVVTRFPPEPNGYLHIGHPKSIALNFGIAQEFGGRCHLRFDDTNPIKEEQEYIDAIQEDIRWLGFDWGENLYYASDYFPQLYDWAVVLITAGKAYVDDQSADEIRETRGNFTEPGSDSPWRGRSVEESLDLFERMRAGEFPDGSRVLRARLDMASPNLNLRDPVLYRILHATHPRTGDEWCIYPLYDFAHGQSDAIEGITHSICTLEFEDHRPLYDWFIENLPVPSHPHQYEFSRLNLTYPVLSKRFLGRLVTEGYVRGWDDPRMPTVSALRRRGFPAEGVRNFLDAVGVGGKGKSVVEIEMLEHEVRDVLNREAARRFAILRPLKLVIENYPEGQVEELEAVNNPEDAEAGTRKVAFSRELWIERDDFMEEPPAKFFRLAPGREVRLRYAYFVTCTEVVKDESGEIVELRCSYDPETRGGDSPDGRRPKATLHRLSAGHAAPAEVRLYDRLFTRPDPGADGDLFADINPDSETVLTGCFAEPALTELPAGETVQFERLGYFCTDLESPPERLVFNRTLGLRDTWARLQK